MIVPFVHRSSGTWTIWWTKYMISDILPRQGYLVQLSPSTLDCKHLHFKEASRKNTGLKSYKSEFEVWLCHLLAIWPWLHHLISLSLNQFLLLLKRNTQTLVLVSLGLNEKQHRFPCWVLACWGSVAKLCPTLVTPWAAAHQASLCPSLPWSLLKFKSTESVILSKHLILCCPLLLLHSVFPSIRVPPNELALHLRRPKYWSFSISPSNEYSWCISLGLTG